MSLGSVNGTGYACGKVILLGEHAVVYGVPAIAAGIERGARARVSPLAAGPSRLVVKGWEVSVSEDQGEHDLARAFSALLEVTRRRTVCAGSPLLVELEAELPPGGGLGCSSAMGVAVARALDPQASAEEVADRAMSWERIFHGNASGVDAAVAAHGGCLYFQRGAPLESLRARAPLVLCVGHTGLASSTKVMVESVARMRERRPAVVDKAFDGIRALVRNARLAIEAGDRFALGRLMDLNQMILGGLFVSTPEGEAMCGSARAAGALGAKLTGAGGGGSVVALVPNNADAQRVLDAWKGDGFDGFCTKVFAHEQRRVLSSEVAP
jgi:mevalonate kinase